MTTALNSWVDGPAKAAIVDFVERVTTEGSKDFVEQQARVAVFDNDGTLWCEKPMYIQLDFLLRRFVEQAQADPALREHQPYKAASERDLQWFGDAITRHYHGDDTQLKTLAAAVFSAHEAMSVEQHAERVRVFFTEAEHPTLRRPYRSCGYSPMVQLLRYLAANGFTSYIVTGGGRDFMRPIAGTIYGIPPDRVIGSALGLNYQEVDGHGNLLIKPALDVFDDGPEKPIRIWNRIGRRPILAAGNSNGDIAMLSYAGIPDTASLRLLLLHDDAEREFDYVAGAEDALAKAERSAWTVVSMKNDWNTVFDT
jgi:phosphoglycolate phosphatase-like HAD superfamily hydrolase